MTLQKRLDPSRFEDLPQPLSLINSSQRGQPVLGHLAQPVPTALLILQYPRVAFHFRSEQPFQEAPAARRPCAHDLLGGGELPVETHQRANLADAGSMTSHGDKSQPAHGGRAVDQINHVRDVGQSVRRLLLEQDQGLGNVELRAEYPCDERGLRRPIMSSSSLLRCSPTPATESKRLAEEKTLDRHRLVIGHLDGDAATVR